MQGTPRWLLPAVLALHAGLLLALAAQPAARPPLALPVAMRVELLAPTTAQPAAAPAPRSDAPRPQPPRPSPSPAPARAEASPSPIAPVEAPAPAQESAAPIATAVAAAPAQTAPAPPVLTAPRFDAAYLNNPAPAYPPLARRLGEQGRVLLRVFVDARGLPEKVEVLASSGSPRLDTSAAETVRSRWRFEPARLGDRPVPDWVRVPIAFNLES